MNRRDIITRSLYTAGGYILLSPVAAEQRMLLPDGKGSNDYFALFRNTDAGYRPFVRWWWNGDKVQPEELIRELRLLKSVGIGGVEINPIKFPENTDDLGVKPLTWLSD